MTPPRVLIVSPALASANNGNWQTASRWSQMLPVAQRGVDDAIETDVAVRRVGEAWIAAQRECP